MGKGIEGRDRGTGWDPGADLLQIQKAELDKEEGVELELDTSGVSCFMAKGE